MNKILIIFLSLALIATTSYADNAQRKRSSGRVPSSASVTTTPATIYSIEVLATGSNGLAIVMDYNTSINPSGNDSKIIAEVGEPTTGSSKFVKFGEDGIKANRGIYLYLSNATAIVHYY